MSKTTELKVSLVALDRRLTVVSGSIYSHSPHPSPQQTATTPNPKPRIKHTRHKEQKANKEGIMYEGKNPNSIEFPLSPKNPGTMHHTLTRRETDV
jgi:hypothetical protein